MLLLLFFGRENLAGSSSLLTLIKALRTVMELSQEKAQALNQPIIYEGRLDCQCCLGAWSSLLSWCVFFPFFLAMSSARLIWSQGRFLDVRKRCWKHRDGHRFIAGVLIPSSLLPPQSSQRPELEHGANTVRDGTADYR